MGQGPGVLRMGQGRGEKEEIADRDTNPQLAAEISTHALFPRPPPPLPHLSKHRSVAKPHGSVSDSTFR